MSFGFVCLVSGLGFEDGGFFCTIIFIYMSRRIVIVDDAPFVREILRQVLTESGFECVGEACDGKEAVEVVTRLQPELVIMDIIMPVQSGLEATRQILAQLPQTRIVACTTEGQKSIVVQAMQAGCRNIIFKPFKKKDILEALKAACQGPEPPAAPL